MSLARLLEEYHAPDVYNSLRGTPGAELAWHPRLEAMHQGTQWHRAGLVATAEQHAAVLQAEARIYPEGRTMTETRVWQTTDPDVAVVEWRDQGTTWQGRSTANGGLSVFEAEDGAVRRVRTFANTAYLTAVESGWTDLLPIDTLLAIPAYHLQPLTPRDFRPYPPSRSSKLHTTPPREFEEPLGIEALVARRYEPTVPFDRTPAEYNLGRSPAGYLEFQGTRWHMAGRNASPVFESLLSSLGAAGAPLFRVIFREGSLSFTHLQTWRVEDDDWVIMEWVSAGDLWDGTPFRNHGLTALHFDEQREIARHREYTDVAYLEAASGDWRARLDEEQLDQFARLACSETYDQPSDNWKPLPIAGS